MSSDKDKYRANVYFGKDIHDIIQTYAKAQKLTFGSIVRRICYIALNSEIMMSNPELKVYERKKDWDKEAK